MENLNNISLEELNKLYTKHNGNLEAIQKELNAINQPGKAKAAAKPKPKELSLAELSELYVKNKADMDTIHSLVNYKPATFRSLTTQQMQELYTKFGQNTFNYYRDNPGVEIVELKPGYTTPMEQYNKVEQRKAELQMLRQQLEIERMEMELQQLRKELGMDPVTEAQ